MQVGKEPGEGQSVSQAPGHQPAEDRAGQQAPMDYKVVETKVTNFAQAQF